MLECAAGGGVDGVVDELSVKLQRGNAALLGCLECVNDPAVPGQALGFLICGVGRSDLGRMDHHTPGHAGCGGPAAVLRVAARIL